MGTNILTNVNTDFHTYVPKNLYRCTRRIRKLTQPTLRQPKARDPFHRQELSIVVVSLANAAALCGPPGCLGLFNPTSSKSPTRQQSATTLPYSLEPARGGGGCSGGELHQMRRLYHEMAASHQTVIPQ